MTNDEKVEAIRARLAGEFDNLTLMKFGPLSGDRFEDIRNILNPLVYNHAFTLGFSVGGSLWPDATDLTEAQIFEAIETRLEDLRRNPREIFEAVGAPYDTYVEDRI